jgi:hypothetical protein
VVPRARLAALCIHIQLFYCTPPFYFSLFSFLGSIFPCLVFSALSEILKRSLHELHISLSTRLCMTSGKSCNRSTFMWITSLAWSSTTVNTSSVFEDCEIFEDGFEDATVVRCLRMICVRVTIILTLVRCLKHTCTVLDDGDV